ncbi:phospholipase-like protein [Tanacetum coccineum]
MEDLSIAIPFIFDIDRHTLELSRHDFCLIIRFRFGKFSLDPKEKDRSKFRARVFPKTPNLNGDHLLDLVKNDVAFNNLDDDDVVRVCLLLALDYVFIGQETKHVLLKPIVNLVDDLSEWDKFPWGEYMWREFHKRVYNVVAKHRKYHLKMLGNNPRYVANYALYGFVFPLKTFSNSIHWWRKDENAIHREVAWSNRLKFEKSNYEMLFYSSNASFQKLTPTSIEMNELWLKSSLEYFTKVTKPNLVLRSATRGSSSSCSFHTCVRTEVRREVHVRTEVHSFVEEEVCTQSVDKGYVPEIVVLEKNVKEQQMQIVDMQRHKVVLDKIFKEQQLQILDMQQRLLSLEHITKTQNNGLSEPDHNVDHLHKVTRMEALLFKLVVLTTSERKGPAINWNDVSENHPVDGLDHQSVEGVSQVTSVNKDLADESESVAIDGLISLQSHDIHSQPFLSPSKVTELINELFTSPNDLGFSQANSVFGCVDVDNMDKDGCITDVKTVARPFLRQRRLGKACVSPYVPPPPTTEVKCKKRRLTTKKPTSRKIIKSVIGADGNEISLLPWNEYGLFKQPNDDWAMASPYLNDMLSRYELPLYYADGIKYGVPWFASGVEKVYFPVNEKDFHWCLAELHIRSGVITFYDSLGGPSNGIEDRIFWLKLRQIFEFHIPTYLDYADVLSHNLPLEVDDSIEVALAYRERLIEFFWKHKMLV